DSGLEVITFKTSPINSLALSPDGKRLAIASINHVKVWDIASFPFREVFALPGFGFVAFGKDGKYLASPSGNNTVKLWAAASGLELLSLADSVDTSSLAFSPDGKSLVTGARYDGSVKVWDLSYTKEAIQFTGSPMAFSPDGKSLIGWASL